MNKTPFAPQSLVSRIFGNAKLRAGAGRRRKPRRKAARAMEALEDRQLLTVFTVTSLEDEPGDYVTLRDAIEEANSNDDDPSDTIVFAPGLIGRIELLEGELEIDENLTIQGPDSPSDLVIDAQGNSRVFTSEGSELAVTLESITITGGTDNEGGGIFFEGATLSLINTTVSDNTSTGLFDGGGGIFVEEGDVTLVNSTVSGNISDGSGGGIFAAQGDVTVISSTVSGNTSDDNGGGIFTAQGDVTLANSTVFGNTSDDGGGIFADGNVTIANSTIAGNTADPGGAAGVFAEDDLTIHNAIVAGNFEDNFASDLDAFGSLTVTNSAIGPDSDVDPGNGNILDVDFTTVLETEVVDGETVPKLAENGGLTKTIALPLSSPAIGAADPALVALFGLVNAEQATATDVFPGFDAANLLTDTNLTPINFATTNSPGGSGNSWVTSARNGASGDYFSSGDDPVLTFELDDVHTLGGVAIWGYGDAPGNDIKAFDLEFSTDGGVTFGSPVSLTKPMYDGTDNFVSSLPLNVATDANFVRMTVTDNHRETGSGGDRVGFDEIRFLLSADQRGVGFSRQVGLPDMGAFEVQDLASIDGNVLTVWGTSKDDVITVTAGTETAPGVYSPTVVSIVTGNTIYERSFAHDEYNAVLVRGLAGHDQITTNVEIPANILGEDGNDTIVGGTHNDLLHGGPGNDSISGGAGDDAIQGEDGDDRIFPEAGSDVVVAGNGNDFIFDNGFSQTPDTLFGNAGNDTLLTLAGNDQLHGGDGNDSMHGGSGNDTLTGGAGDDTIQGQSGNDSINGESGNDSLLGGNGNDTLLGDDGKDTISGGSGNDTMHGGIGNDRFYGDDGDDVGFGEGGKDTLFGGAGNDSLNGGDGRDRHFGNDGDDTLVGGNGDDFLSAHAGNDLLQGEAGSDHLLGSSGNDELYGGADADVLSGGFGNDTLEGEAGGDNLIGGPDSDSLNGGAGADSAFGGGGSDTLSGGDGNDTLFGSAGNDVLLGEGNSDSLNGGGGLDYLVGGEGNDSMQGSQGADTLLGGNGSDSLGGGSGDDFIVGGAGNDTLSGSQGDDVLEGQAGDDSMHGGSGDDTLLGGDGNDSMRGSKGRDLLVGGDGLDTLRGDNGRDALFGGAGADSMTGGLGEDLMVGYDSGMTDADYAAINAEWSSDNTYTQRVNNLRDGSGTTGGGANGNLFLPNVLLEDSAADRLQGLDDLDYFWGTATEVEDLFASELRDQI